MNPWFKLWLCLIFVGFSNFVFAQNDFEFKRKIEFDSKEESLNYVQIPEEMYPRLKADFSDLRIFGIKGKDTIKVGHKLRVLPDVSALVRRELPIINSVKTDQLYYFTFETAGEPQLVNYLNLQFANANFDWKIKLEGSNDQNSWFEILNDYRLVSIQQPNAAYRFEELFFPDSKFKFYRISLASPEPPQLQSVHSTYVKSDETMKFKELSVRDFELKSDSKNNLMTLILPLKSPMPVYSLDFKINTKSDFKRIISVEYLKDSIETEKGYLKQYAPFSSGEISPKNTVFAYDENAFLFTNEFRIVIDNQDNQPLEISSIDLQILTIDLLFEIQDFDLDYYLFYGDKTAVQPQFDVNFSLDQNFVQQQLGDEQINPKKAEKTTAPMFENEWWLWVLMSAIMAFLGFFSWKMMRK